MSLSCIDIIKNHKNPAAYIGINHELKQECLNYIVSLGVDTEGMNASDITFFIKNDLKIRPVCPITGKYLTLTKRNGKWQYRKYDPSVKYQQLDEWKEKFKQTSREKYGTDHPTQCKEIQDKTKQTNLEKYGTACVLANQQIREKIKQTNLEEYGSEHITQTEHFKQLSKETMSKKYGVEHAQQSAEIREKTKQSNMERLDVEWPTQSAVVREKVKQTCLDRYKVEYICQSENVKKKQQASFLPSKIKTAKRHYQQFKACSYSQPNFTENEFINYRVGGNICDLEWISTGDNKIYKAPYYLHYNGRPPVGFKSSIEIKLKNFFNTHNVNHINNCRSILDGLELDFYLPDHNIAIECNGLYWHSSEYKSITYHLNKSEICASKGIRLIHLWEDEINEKWPIVESRLRSLLNINQTNVYARKCTISLVDFKTAKQFLDNNHLLGKDQANINLGLYCDNTLTAIMTFNKPTTIGSKTTDYILSRYCCLLNHRVVGGPSKLLKHFVKTYQPKNIQTYAEVRFGEGKMYKTLGFTYSHRSRPSYFVVCNGQRYHRQRFMHKHLSKLLENYDPNLSEKQNCENHGYYRLYDCGKDVYVCNLCSSCSIH